MSRNEMDIVRETTEHMLQLRALCRKACKTLLHLRNIPEAKQDNDEAYRNLVKCWARCEETHDVLEEGGFMIDRVEAEATDFYQLP